MSSSERIRILKFLRVGWEEYTRPTSFLIHKFVETDIDIYPDLPAFASSRILSHLNWHAVYGLTTLTSIHTKSIYSSLLAHPPIWHHRSDTTLCGSLSHFHPSSDLTPRTLCSRLPYRRPSRWSSSSVRAVHGGSCSIDKNDWYHLPQNWIWNRILRLRFKKRFLVGNYHANIFFLSKVGVFVKQMNFRSASKAHALSIMYNIRIRDYSSEFNPHPNS